MNAHRHVVQDVALLGLTLAQHLLDLVLGGNVLQHGQMVGGGLAGGPHGGDVYIDPDGVPILVAHALFDAVFMNFPFEQTLLLGHGLGQVLGIDQFLERPGGQLLRGVAQNVGTAGVGLQQVPSLRIGQRDAHAGLVKDGLEVGLAGLQGPRMAAHQPADKAPQQQRQQAAACAQPPRLHALGRRQQRLGG